MLCAAQLTVNLADVATALDAEADVQEAPPLLAQQHQRLKHLLPKRLRLDELKRDACGTNGGGGISSVTLASLSTGILIERFYMLLSPEHTAQMVAAAAVAATSSQERLLAAAVCSKLLHRQDLMTDIAHHQRGLGTWSAAAAAAWLLAAQQSRSGLAARPLLTAAPLSFTSPLPGLA